MKLLDGFDLAVLAVAGGITIGLGVLTENMGLGPLPGILLAVALIIIFTQVMRP